ncbi:MAG: hypothetical protein HY324_00800, partial [Chlamydiia bacterium]|nr:hypothetical protein [Chlamydiia bacterium]
LSASAKRYFCDGSEGPFRLTQMISKASQCINETLKFLGRTPSPYVAALASSCGAALAPFSLPATIQLNIDARKPAIPADDLYHKKGALSDDEMMARKVHLHRKNLTTKLEAASVNGLTASFFLGFNPAMKAHADRFKKISDITGTSASFLKIFTARGNIQQGHVIDQLLDKQPSEVSQDRQEDISDAKNLIEVTRMRDRLTLAKETTALFVSLIGLAAGFGLMTTGFSPSFSLALTVISAASTVFAVWRGILDEQMEFKPIDTLLRRQELEASLNSSRS